MRKSTSHTLEPSARATACVAALVVLTGLILAPAAQAGKYIDRIITNSVGGEGGPGELNNPRGLAVNNGGIDDGSTDPLGASTDGYLYVVDEKNHRVQVFDANDNFRFMFGNEVNSGTSGNPDLCTNAGPPTDVCGPGAPAAGDGDFKNPNSIAINQDTGDIYVHGGERFLDTDNLRVQQFEADGTFIRAWGWGVDDGSNAFQVCTSGCQAGTLGANGGQFGRSTTFGARGIAVDPLPPHHVFAGDPANERIHEFEADGDFVRLWGEDVVSPGQPGNTGTGFEVCQSTTAGVCKAGPVFSLRNPRDLTVDASGVVYQGTQFGGVLRFDASAGGSAVVPMTSISVSGGSTGPLAIVPGSENLLVPFGSVSGAIAEFDVGVPPPAEIDRHVQSPGFDPSRLGGLAVDPDSGELYLAISYADSGDAGDGDVEDLHFLFAADDDGAPPAELAIDPVAVIDANTADLSGTVTPNGPAGFITTYNFQYSEDGVEWTTVAASDNPVGEGTTPVTVSDTATGLKPNASYRARLVARKSFGNPEIHSAEAVFQTEAAPPSVQTLPTTQRSATGARLYGRINPNNSATQYWFEWGTDTGYGNKVPVPNGSAGSGFGDVVVAEFLPGLEPNSTYHYRVVADNEVEQSPGVTEVYGNDQAFTTRPLVPGRGSRAYEMVTPPFKVTRATGHPEGGSEDNANPAIASLDGETLAWNVSILPLADDVAAPLTGDKRILRRTSNGWANATRNTLGLLDLAPGIEAPSPAFFTKVNPGASSGDFETMSWLVLDNHKSGAGMLPTAGQYANRLYTRRDGTGVEGFTPWLTNPEQQIAEQGFFVGEASSNEITTGAGDQSILNDSGTAMARGGHYRGLGELPGAGDEDPSDDQQLNGMMGGGSAYVQRAADPDELPAASKELINQCTGTTDTGSATQIPSRVGTGASTDTIGAHACTHGSVVNRRGATIGGGGDKEANGGPMATALAGDGSRVFFQAPDFGATTSAHGSSQHASVRACTTGLAANTACPPQLFVRQYDSGNNPIVRWVSRSRSVPTGEGAFGGAMIAGQRIAEMGRGVAFQGASRTGKVVYFKTNAPLTPDDPNSEVSIVEGAAQESSWDLYRYELPGSLDADPGDGELQRISGGPTGAADPGVVASSTVGDTVSDASLRFHSDDGNRAYFLTTSPIVGADEVPPVGGATAPGGTPGNLEVRNLYLFDATKTGADRWRFIARMPYGLNSAGGLNGCATAHLLVADQLQVTERGVKPESGNCFRGTRDGSGVLFATAGRLTDDDGDEASDIYLYDASSDELVRLTAPPAGVDGYPCVVHDDVDGQFVCNGELGRNQGRGFFSMPIGPWDISRGWGGMRYYNLSQDENGVVSAYFATKLSLVPEDTNGNHMDVYEWRQGDLSLISPGNSAHDAWFSGNSLDGQDVFFNTGQRIDPREIDDADLDIYDARIGGGFPYTPPPTPCDVLAFGCEGEAIAPPAPMGSASQGFSGSGNVKPRTKPKRRRCAKRKVRRGKRCVARRNAKRRANGKKRRARNAKKRRAKSGKKQRAKRERAAR